MLTFAGLRAPTPRAGGGSPREESSDFMGNCGMSARDLFKPRLLGTLRRATAARRSVGAAERGAFAAISAQT